MFRLLLMLLLSIGHLLVVHISVEGGQLRLRLALVLGLVLGLVGHDGRSPQRRWPCRCHLGTVGYNLDKCVIRKLRRVSACIQKRSNLFCPGSVCCTGFISHEIYDHVPYIWVNSHIPVTRTGCQWKVMGIASKIYEEKENGLEGFRNGCVELNGYKDGCVRWLCRWLHSWLWGIIQATGIFQDGW